MIGNDEAGFAEFVAARQAALSRTAYLLTANHAEHGWERSGEDNLGAQMTEGFRRAENIRAALDGELSFYAQVLGFELPAEEGIEPIHVVR